MAPLFISK
jgi:peroxisomal 2,4-dienoyl-CoA reductase